MFLNEVLTSFRNTYMYAPSNNNKCYLPLIISSPSPPPHLSHLRSPPPLIYLTSVPLPPPPSSISPPFPSSPPPSKLFLPSHCYLQTVMGCFQMGFITIFLSEPLISGYTTGAALLVVTTQLPHMLGTYIKLKPIVTYFPDVLSLPRVSKIHVYMYMYVHTHCTHFTCIHIHVHMCVVYMYTCV